MTQSPAIPIPPRPLILFDCECDFCGRQILRIRRAAADGQFDFAAMSDPAIADQFPQLLAVAAVDGMRFLDERGQVFVAADAVFEVARRLPRWRLVAQLYRVPGLRAVFRWVYGCIARHRRRL